MVVHVQHAELSAFASHNIRSTDPESSQDKDESLPFAILLQLFADDAVFIYVD
jgi:hypothetical protein